MITGEFTVNTVAAVGLGRGDELDRGGRARREAVALSPVSYTHLTLPTTGS